MDHSFQKPEKGSRMLRKGRRSLSHQIYFISTFKDSKAARLDNELCFRVILGVLDRLEREEICEWFAFVVMPDHIHLVVRLGENINLSEMVKRLKGASAVEINKRRGVKGALWYKGFHDRMVREHEKVSSYVRYVCENPVRKGLVREASEWEYTRVKWELTA